MNVFLLLQDIKGVFIGLYKYIQQHFSLGCFIVAIINFIATFYTDNLIFEYDDIDIFNIIKIKIIFLIILVFIWQFVGYLIKNYSMSDNIKNFIKFSGIYFFIMMLFQLALWPFIVGNQMYYGYFNDTIHLSNNAVFQGIFIRHFRIYSLMLIPNIAGIPIIQVLTIALIIGYIMQTIKNYFKLNKSVYFFYVPFLSPLIIQFNLHIEKDILYGYSLLFLIAILLFHKLEKSLDKLNMNLFFIAVLSAVVASIRPGGIFFFVTTPAILYLLNYKFINLQKIILFTVFSILISMIFIPNIVSTVVLDKNGESYKNVYILNKTFKVLLKEAVEDDNEYILDEFESGTNLNPEKILSKNTILCDGFFTKLPERDKDKFEIISKKLIKEYYDEYVQYKFMRFCFQQRLIDLNPNPHDISKYDYYSYKSYIAIKDKIVQISPTLYAKVIGYFKTYNSYLGHPYYTLIMLLIAIYGICFFVSILFRIKKVFIIICFLIGYIIFQILIVPYPGFRFFFPCYITAYLVMFYLIFYFISNKKNNTD